MKPFKIQKIESTTEQGVQVHEFQSATPEEFSQFIERLRTNSLLDEERAKLQESGELDLSNLFIQVRGQSPRSLSDEECQKLAEALRRNRMVQNLNLKNADISVQGLAAISSIFTGTPKNTNIIKVDIDGNGRDLAKAEKETKKAQEVVLGYVQKINELLEKFPELEGTHKKYISSEELPGPEYQESVKKVFNYYIKELQDTLPTAKRGEKKTIDEKIAKINAAKGQLDTFYKYHKELRQANELVGKKRKSESSLQTQQNKTIEVFIEGTKQNATSQKARQVKEQKREALAKLSRAAEERAQYRVEGKPLPREPKKQAEWDLMQKRQAKLKLSALKQVQRKAKKVDNVNIQPELAGASEQYQRLLNELQAERDKKMQAVEEIWRKYPNEKKPKYPDHPVRIEDERLMKEYLNLLFNKAGFLEREKKLNRDISTGDLEKNYARALERAWDDAHPLTHNVKIQTAYDHGIDLKKEVDMMDNAIKFLKDNKKDFINEHKLRKGKNAFDPLTTYLKQQKEHHYEEVQNELWYTRDKMVSRPQYEGKWYHAIFKWYNWMKERDIRKLFNKFTNVFSDTEKLFKDIKKPVAPEKPEVAQKTKPTGLKH